MTIKKPNVFLWENHPKIKVFCKSHDLPATVAQCRQMGVASGSANLN